MMNRLRILALMVLGPVACGGEMLGDASRGFERWDSAGVTISMSPDSMWTRETRWSVTPEPSFVIGTRDGDDPHTVFGRVCDVDVLSDGRIVVADCQANEIRVFDKEGGYINTLGGSGGGPGELRKLTGIAALNGDSIVGHEWEASKYTIFASDGSDSRTVTGPPFIWNDLFPVSVFGWLPDGSPIVSHEVQSSDLPPGTNLISAEWHLFDPLGNHRAFLGSLPSLWGNREGGGREIAFSALAVFQPDDNGIWHGFPEKFELAHYTAGGLDRIIRTGYVPPRVPETVKRIVRSGAAKKVEFAERLPAYRRFIISKDGYFWLEHYETIEDMLNPAWARRELPHEEEWNVLSPDGEWLGTVEMPLGLTLRVVTEDRILGIVRDEWDVRYVVVHVLAKPT